MFFFFVVIVGFWYVKWEFYYGKVFIVVEIYSIGKFIFV